MCPYLSTEPRKQPRQERAKETLRAVYQAILEFAELGKIDPSVAAIAQRAGVSVGSLYQYFPSKRALASGLLKFYTEKRAAILVRDLVEAQSLKGAEAAEALIDAVLGIGRKRTASDRAVAEFVLLHGDVASLIAFDEQMIDAVEQFLMARRKELRPKDLRVAAFLIFNALRASVPLAVLQRPDWVGSPTFRAELVALVVRYLEAQTA